MGKFNIFEFKFGKEKKTLKELIKIGAIIHGSLDLISLLPGVEKRKVFNLLHFDERELFFDSIEKGDFKTTKYLLDLDEKKLITILRQIAKIFDYNVTSNEKYLNSKKVLQYSLEKNNPIFDDVNYNLKIIDF